MQNITEQSWALTPPFAPTAHGEKVTKGTFVPRIVKYVCCDQWHKTRPLTTLPMHVAIATFPATTTTTMTDARCIAISDISSFGGTETVIYVRWAPFPHIVLVQCTQYYSSTVNNVMCTVSIPKDFTNPTPPTIYQHRLTRFIVWAHPGPPTCRDRCGRRAALDTHTHLVII